MYYGVVCVRIMLPATRDALHNHERMPKVPEALSTCRMIQGVLSIASSMGSAHHERGVSFERVPFEEEKRCRERDE